jgi:dolichol-phosphate mannosyltransferase
MRATEQASPSVIAASVDYSIDIPVYYNEGALTRTMDAIRKEVIDANPDRTWEVIFVDDGSGDGSYRELLGLQAQAPAGCVRVIKLTRNFGQVSAILAGMAHVRGRCAVIMSADGQDPPGLINEMLAGHFEEGYEVVICAREGRDESAARVWASKFFYGLMRRLSFANMPPGGFDYVLLGRSAIEVFNSNLEAHLFLQGKILWMGFKHKIILYRRRRREIGKSRWTLGKQVTYLIDGALSYSHLPLRCMSLVGILCSLLGFGYAALVIIVKLVWGNPVQGWTPLVVIVLMMGGVQMLMLGVIGEYLWRTLQQTRNRDPYVVESIHDGGSGHTQTVGTTEA